jgi:hypothetical protein
MMSDSEGLLKWYGLFVMRADDAGKVLGIIYSKVHVTCQRLRTSHASSVSTGNDSHLQ